MHWKRLTALYCLLVAATWGLVCRLYLTSQNHTYAARAQGQTVTTLTLPPRRGDFYDRNGRALTGSQPEWYALCIPGTGSYARLFDYACPADQKLLYHRRNAAAPFLVRVRQDLSTEGIYTVKRVRRYLPLPLCPHLIGYLNDAGQGVSGLEWAMDDILASSAPPDVIRCVTNARGGLMPAEAPHLQSRESSLTSVQLTIDSPVQAAVEGIGQGMLTTGCIVVLDTATAQVLACASFPDFTPDTVAESMAGGDAALLNRAFAPYAVGSVFKPLLAAAALEENTPLPQYDCPGYLNWYHQIYRCAGGIPHGPVDLPAALEKSCNGYFVQLGKAIGGDALLQYAQQLGFGQPVYLSGGLKAAAGVLPDKNQLKNVGALANFSFGQGSLLATPVQIAGMMNALAADGVYRVPTFLIRSFADATGETVEDLQPKFPAVQVFSRETARTVQTMLAGVVADGLGKAAAPTWKTAAGKTGTAQTGRFAPTGKEYVNLWFAGFWPAEKPEYTIVVMQDDQTKPLHSSAAVFARVCDALYLLNPEKELSAPAPRPTDNGDEERTA